MTHTLKKLEKSQAELTFTIPASDYKKDLEQAAVRISQRAAIKGFRPGKAPYDIVKQQVGEATIMQEATEHIVQRTYFVAVKEEKLEAVGMPNIKVEKMAPGNDFVYTATVALLPEVKLPDLKEIKIEKKKTEVGEKEMGDVLDNLKKMQPKEIAKDGAATKDDKVTINMNMFIDKVPMEGGQAPDHQVYLSEAHYIPGLAEQLIGLKKGDEKEFTLPFPKDHYQKHFAGKDVDFKIKVNEVFTLQYPELNDEFAVSLGQKNMEELKKLLLANLAREAERKEDERVEVAMLDQMIEKTTFGELPDILVDSEKRKMFYELTNDLDRRGITIEQYLKDIKKTEQDISNDFTEGATKRAKAALISREVAKENNISVSSAELDKEIESIKAAYAGDKNVEENLKKPEVIDTIAATVQNRKVIKLLKEKVLE